MFEKRIEKLLSYIPLERFSILIKDGPNMFYLTGFDGEGYLCLGPKGAVLFTDGRYMEDASSICKGIEIRPLKKSGLDFLLSCYEGGPVFVEYSRMTCRELLDLQKLPLSGNISSIDWALSDMRKVKDEKELSAMKRAIAVSERSLFYVLDNYLSEGVMELDLAAEFIYRLNKEGCSPSFDPIFLFGENTSKPHGKPSTRSLKKGDVVLVDFGARCSGYCSDQTVTFSFGTPSDEFVSYFGFVREAKEKASEVIQRSIDIGEAVRSVKVYFSSKGVGDLFLHSLGHGLGIEVHEPPVLCENPKEKLSKGSVFTLEPGLYRAGEFGVRLEDMYLIEDRGKLYRLTGFPKVPTYDEMMDLLVQGGFGHGGCDQRV